METLLKIILKTEPQDRLPFNHPIIRSIEESIDKQERIYKNIEKYNCSETTKNVVAKQICIKVMTLAKYGYIPKAIEYALSFDKKFNMEDIIDDSILNE